MHRIKNRQRSDANKVSESIEESNLRNVTNKNSRTEKSCENNRRKKHAEAQKYASFMEFVTIFCGGSSVVLHSNSNGQIVLHPCRLSLYLSLSFSPLPSSNLLIFVCAVLLHSFLSTLGVIASSICN